MLRAPLLELPPDIDTALATTTAGLSGRDLLKLIAAHELLREHGLKR